MALEGENAITSEEERDIFGSEAASFLPETSENEIVANQPNLV